jgi:hypothetical protein
MESTERYECYKITPLPIKVSSGILYEWYSKNKVPKLKYMR